MFSFSLCVGRKKKLSFCDLYSNEKCRENTTGRDETRRSSLVSSLYNLSRFLASTTSVIFIHSWPGDFSVLPLSQHFSATQPLNSRGISYGELLWKRYCIVRNLSIFKSTLSQFLVRKPPFFDCKADLLGNKNRGNLSILVFPSAAYNYAKNRAAFRFANRKVSFATIGPSTSLVTSDFDNSHKTFSLSTRLGSRLSQSIGRWLPEGSWKKMAFGCALTMPSLGKQSSF